MRDNTMAAIVCLIIAYLLGSLSSAILYSKFTGAKDPRTTGSGNPGATNVLRASGKQAALIVLGGDVAKGLIAVLLARMVGVNSFMLGLVGLAAVAGHCFPVYFKFKGGKGVATALGAILALSFWAAILSAAILVAIIAITRYVSLAS